MEHVDEAWRKSTYSGSNGGGCVEVATLPDDIGVRDSTDPDPNRPVLRFGADTWREFLESVR
jgi:hypothetical protein